MEPKQAEPVKKPAPSKKGLKGPRLDKMIRGSVREK